MNSQPLSSLSVGQSSYVISLKPDCPLQRRLLDIGLIPGTKVTCVGKSPVGDPSAYLIRGAVIALRACDASDVRIKSDLLS